MSSEERIHIYTDGACMGNPGPGSWAAIIIDEDKKKALSGREGNTTSNRMELMAAIKGLECTPDGSHVTIHSDSQYLVNTMTRGWKRRANLDLWERLDALASRRDVEWEWVRGHTGHPVMEEAHRLADEMAGISGATVLTHVDSDGKARMVDIAGKPDTVREAIAKGSVVMKPETLALIRRGEISKGDVFAVARVAGIMAAKETYRLIPLCHPIPLSQIAVELTPDEEKGSVEITATAKSVGKTGVEMEALTAVAVSALTIYDMCKAADRGMRIEGIRLIRKSGGRSGTIQLE